jgi:hypothetical protein
MEANQEKQKVTLIYEWSLVQFMHESADRGFPLLHSQIEHHANTILQVTHSVDFEPIGAKWVLAFLDQHHAVL